MNKHHFPGATGITLSLSMAIALLLLPLARPALAGKPAVKATINIGVKNFAEEQIIADMYQLRLQKDGFAVKQHQLAETPALQSALLKGQIDLYPEYTGTGLTSVLYPNSTKLYTNAIQAYDIVKTQYEKRFHLTWLLQTPMNDTNGIAVTRATSRKYHLHTLSNLAKVAKKLTFAEDPACKDRSDCLKGMEQHYGIHFKQVTDVGSGPLRYAGLTSGKYDVIEVFTTDPPIFKDHLVVLTDNKKAIFPADHLAPVVRDPVLKKYPKIRPALNGIARYLTTKVMIQLNGKVILQNQDPMTVARTFLQSKHLL